MKLIGLMLARNEDWILGMTARVALQWCDELVIVDHASWDGTEGIITQLNGEFPFRVNRSKWDDDTKWDEMEIRQHSLELGRKFGGTHFAIIDSDEALTYNLLADVRSAFEKLEPGQCLDLPMIAPHRGLGMYRDDQSVWSRSKITLGFRDVRPVGKDPGLFWKARDVGYQHHARPPQGVQEKRLEPLADKRQGGVFHLQWASWDRLLWKHRAYKMMEVIRWPGREPVAEVDRKYSQALDESEIKLSPIPDHFWGDYPKSLVRLKHNPWYIGECHRMLAEKGKDYFAGLDLCGFPKEWPV